MARRLSTIVIDNSSALAPAQWCGSWVQQRLIEAYAIERRLPHKRPSKISNVWPAMQVEFSDIVGRADDAREEILQLWEYCYASVSAQEISRMEVAQDWLRIILAPYPQERLCLSAWAATIAYRRSLRRLMLQRRWSRSTFYRHVTAGAHVIALELKRQGCPVA
jgi:hypothetical protein